MRNLNLTSIEIHDIVSYCSEEVRRQKDGPLHVGYMVDGWLYAIELKSNINQLGLIAIEQFGKLVEPNDNALGFRGTNIWIGGKMGPRVDDLPRLLDRWKMNLPDMTPAEAYKEFELIHPFADGNGRTGKIIFNYLNGSLLKPEWPPNFWGIANP